MSTGIEEAAIGMFVLATACLIVCIGAVSMVRSLRVILSSPDGRLQRTRQIVKVSMRRIIVSMVAMTVLVVAWRYQEDAQLRSSVKPTDCDHEQSADGRYTASYCYVASKIILRVYAPEGASNFWLKRPIRATHTILSAFIGKTMHYAMRTVTI
jgi:hypothetical protein